MEKYIYLLAATAKYFLLNEVKTQYCRLSAVEVYGCRVSRLLRSLQWIRANLLSAQHDGGDLACYNLDADGEMAAMSCEMRIYEEDDSMLSSK
jgi:hypothetical protein